MIESKLEIFTSVKDILSTYEKALEARMIKENCYELYSRVKIQIGKQQKEEMFFAGLMIHKAHVGFYFMPLYTHPKVFDKINPDLKKIQKGKSCFNLTYLDESLLGEVCKLLQEGFNLYKKEGWIQ